MKEVRSVSLVVVNYNAGVFLENCLKAALPQVDEIIVVDNASQDSSLENCTKIFADQKNVIFLQNNKNLGFAVACNMGFRRAKGDFIFFLNPDCRLEESTVSKLCNALLKSPHNGMVGGLLLNPDGSEQGGARRAVPTPWRSFVRATGLYYLQNRWPRLFFDFYLYKQLLPEGPTEMEAISGACMMVLRTALLDVGLWDENYFLHCEDLDLCMRFRQKGWKILFVPDAHVHHALGVCSRNRSFFVEWHKHKGMVRFYKKFFRRQYPLGLMGLVVFGVWVRFTLVVMWKSLRLLKTSILSC